MSPRLRFFRSVAFCHLSAALLSGLPVSSVYADNSTETFFGLDLNKNHLSEFFEEMYPTAANPNEDTDGDGQTNLQESASGTNPTDARDRLDFKDLASTASLITAKWNTARGKTYQMQASTSLSGGWVNEGSLMMGTGGEVTGTCANQGTRMFLRLQVQDTDSDNDGVSDWEEYIAGTNPVKRDTEGDGISDYDRLSRKLGMGCFVDVIASDPIASESGDPATFKIIRRGNLNAINVSFAWSGTATFGTDYTAPTSVYLGFGVNSATVTMTPLNDALVETPNEVATMTLSAGAGYSVGELNHASATIIVQGMGLTGNYFRNSLLTGNIYNSSNPYVSGANFNPAEIFETRLDGPINYSTAAAPAWNAGITAVDDYLSVVWSGYILPPATQTYTFYSTANGGSRLWVNGVSLFDTATATPETTAWTGSSGVELSKTIALTVGQLYPIRLEWHDETGTSSIRLRWSHPTLTKADIPVAQLYPAASPPVLPATAFAVAFVGGPFSYQVTGKPNTTGYDAAGLPSGLTINTSTGEIKGTTTALPGLYFSSVVASNALGTASLNLTILVLQSGGGLTRDVWSGLATASVEDIPLASTPTTTTTVSTFAAPANDGDNYGERIRGFLTAPKTGNYTFFLTSSDENAELWVSADDDPSRTLKRSFLTNTAAAGNWNAAASQKSLQMELEAGKRYYIESRRKETTGDDQLKVGWLKPDEAGTVPSEIIPAYVLTPFTPGTALTGTGTLYVATLTPQAGAVTFGNGTAVLLVNEAETGATMSYTYSGLTGPINNQHIHDGASLPGPAKAIIYDLDEHNPDAFGVRSWTFAPTGNFTVPDLVNAIKSGTAYLNLHTAAYPDGEIKGFFFKATGTRTFIPPAPPAPEAWPTVDANEASRFLTQATMGPKRDDDGASPWDPDSIENVIDLGYSGWIDQQLAMSPGTDPEVLAIQTLPNPDPPTVDQVAGTAAYSPLVTVNNGSGPMCAYLRDYYAKFPHLGDIGTTGNPTQSSAELYRAWWKQSLSAQDQLRQRVAFALSQILVISEQGVLDDNSRAVAHYYDILYYHGLGNFRTLLEKVTLNVPMGRYLDMFRNKKPTTSSIPNENYGREIMQLFSIGLNRLHPDGSLVLNAQGFPVPTYSQDQVVGLAHVFTGWTHAADNATFNASASTNYILPMIPFSAQHSINEKSLLDNYIIPVSTVATTQTTTDELEASLDMIFNHPNVGPFICRQLIQRMVTANPSKGYIYRMSRVFADNGLGVRGDMKALVKAMLLDPEARTLSARQTPEYGKLREPLLRVTGLVRGLRGYSTSSLYSAFPQLPHAQVATQTNVNISAALPKDANNFTFVDGIRLWPGMRVLVKAQSTPSENGLYDFTGEDNALTRNATPVTNGYVRVSYGTDTAKTYKVALDGTTWGTISGGNPLANQWNIGETGSGTLFQTPLKAPTVFNFYEPDYQFPGATGAAKLYGPEFQILSETSIVNTTNMYYSLLESSGYNDLRVEFATRPSTYPGTYPWSAPLGVTNPRSNPLISLAPVGSDLVGELNTVLMGGRMSTALKTLITNYINTITLRADNPPNNTNNNADRLTRVRDACYLFALSHEYSIQR